MINNTVKLENHPKIWLAPTSKLMNSPKKMMNPKPVVMEKTLLPNPVVKEKVLIAAPKKKPEIFLCKICWTAYKTEAGYLKHCDTHPKDEPNQEKVPIKKMKKNVKNTDGRPKKKIKVVKFPTNVVRRDLFSKTSEVDSKSSEKSPKSSEIGAKSSEISSKTSAISTKTSEKSSKTSDKDSKSNEIGSKSSQIETIDLVNDTNSIKNKTDKEKITRILRQKKLPELKPKGFQEIAPNTTSTDIPIPTSSSAPQINLVIIPHAGSAPQPVTNNSRFVINNYLPNSTSELPNPIVINQSNIQSQHPGGQTTTLTNSLPQMNYVVIPQGGNASNLIQFQQPGYVFLQGQGQSSLLGPQQLNAQTIGIQAMNNIQQLNAQSLGIQQLNAQSLGFQQLNAQPLGIQQLNGLGVQQMNAQGLDGQQLRAQQFPNPVAPTLQNLLMNMPVGSPANNFSMKR